MFLPIRLIPISVQCIVLNTALDLFLSNAKDLEGTLDALDGSVIQINVSDIQQVFFLGFEQHNIWVHPKHHQNADVILESSTTGFARLCFNGEDADELVLQKVMRLSGDSHIMLQFKKLFEQMDMDWDVTLQHAFGYRFGKRVSSAAKKLIELDQQCQVGGHAWAQRQLLRQGVPNEQRFEACLAGVEELQRQSQQLNKRMQRAQRYLKSLQS